MKGKGDNEWGKIEELRKVRNMEEKCGIPFFGKENIFQP